MERGLAVPAHPVEHLLVGLHLRPGGQLASIEGGERRLREDRPGDPDRFDPFPPVLLGRQVVEAEGRVHPGVGAHDLHRTTCVGVHRPDVHLIAVVPGRSRPVVADSDREEVEHQVRIGDLVVAPGEAAGLEMVRRAEPRAEEQPLGADERLAPVLQPGSDRDGLRARVLDVHLEVILEMFADPRDVLHHVHAERAELIGVADTRELQCLGGIDGATAQDHFPCANPPSGTSPSRRTRRRRLGFLRTGSC